MSLIIGNVDGFVQILDSEPHLLDEPVSAMPQAGVHVHLSLLSYAALKVQSLVRFELRDPSPSHG